VETPAVKRNPRNLIALLLLILSVGLATLWFAGRDQSLSTLRERAFIRVGYSIEAPYAYLSPSGEVTGESPEVARRIVERLKIPRIEWRYVKFASLLRELEAGRIDVIAAGMFITPERGEKALFSEPTFHVRQGLLVRKGNPRRLHSYAQAAKIPGVRVAVLSGSVEESLLKNADLPKERLVAVPDARSGLVTVETGTADGLALSSPSLRWMLMQEKSGALEMAQPFEQPVSLRMGKEGYGAFLFRKKDRALQKAWNSAQQGFIGSPAHLAVIRSFGFTDVELPGAVTTSEVLAP